MVEFRTVIAIAIPVLYVIMTIVYEAGNYIYYEKRDNMTNPPPGPSMTESHPSVLLTPQASFLVMLAISTPLLLV
jgi:hypothetical protein